MITIVSDAEEISKYYSRFEARIRKDFNTAYKRTVGHPGESFANTFHYSNTYGLWVTQKVLNSRYWSGFGLGEPKSTGSNSIDGEINFPLKGIDRKIAGAFAIEGKNVLVLHRGRIGGGKKGVGKGLFDAQFRGDKVIAIDGGRETEFALVGELGSRYFIDQLRVFIHEVYRIKHLGKSTPGIVSQLNRFIYKPEAFGQNVIPVKKQRSINRTHGIVVNQLAEKLEESGLHVGNDANRDLYVHNESQIQVLFEIKTSSTPHDLYCALGQLLFYSMPLKKSTKKIVVLPDVLKSMLERRLKEYGVDILYYKWKAGRVVFKELEKTMQL